MALSVSANPEIEKQTAIRSRIHVRRLIVSPETAALWHPLERPRTQVAVLWPLIWTADPGRLYERASAATRGSASIDRQRVSSTRTAIAVVTIIGSSIQLPSLSRRGLILRGTIAASAT